MNYFTEVGEFGEIVRSRFTADPSTTVAPGHRLLLDDPPRPPAFNPLFQRLVRIEPVLPTHHAIQYQIIHSVSQLNENEVVL
jgi:hypothetical protein